MERYHYSAQDFSTKKGAPAALLRLLGYGQPFYSPGGARVELGATSTH